MGQLINGLKIIYSTLRFKANVLIFASGTHPFILSVLPMFGVKVISVLHCNILLNTRGKLSTRFINKLNSLFFSYCCSGILSASNAVSEEVRRATNNRPPPIHDFLPIYRPDFLSECVSPPQIVDRFNLLYIGRIERSKGVFDLIEIYSQLADSGYDINIAICGNGSGLDELRELIVRKGLGNRIQCYGHCDQQSIKKKFNNSHALIVPTRSDIGEGFAMTVIEGILAGLPVISSSACPANAYVSGGIVEVQADDIEGYTAAIVKLYDPDFYQSKLDRIPALQGRFYDANNGFGAVLLKSMTANGVPTISSVDQVDICSKLTKERIASEPIIWVQPKNQYF
ncbi:Uncharacterized protein SCG7086_DF_00030 [Chlamydiales bacterium SCGC AG-110-P3]|nr:Uncharacterized protein SCG7086_DF_00030 [Chlamydiales bacterium SCGC AG-110-P3]